jgi:hypothetical protein
MLSLAFVLLLLLTPNAQRSAAPKRAAPPPAASLPYAGDLFSRRARRRAAIMLRLKWDELRLAELERVRAAIRREIPIDDLLKR